MLALLVALSTSALAVSPLEIHVPDGVLAVSLVCGRDVERVEVRAGRAVFSRAPSSAGCSVRFEQEVGTVNLHGEWSCDHTGCRHTEVAHRPVHDAAGRLNVILDGDSHSITELVCPGGFRARSTFAEHVAVFDGVPDEECILHFKGGSPARYRPVQVGTWQCKVIGGTAVCGRK